MGVPHVELDSLYWETGWQPVSREVLRDRISLALGEGWVTDGNYSQARDLIWESADTLIWLDMPLPVALWRVVSGEVLWNSNRETFRDAIFSRDGLVLYLLSSHRRHRQQYPRLLALPEYAHLRVIRLRSARGVARWLESVPSDGQAWRAGVGF